MIDIVLIGACGVVWVVSILGTLIFRKDIRRRVRINVE